MQESTKEQLQRLAGSSGAHIAVMSKPFLDYVLEGKKTVESRFSLHNIPPYQKVQPGDVVFMKAGQVVGCFTVAWVKYFDLHDYSIEKIKKQYSARICGDADFWQGKSTKRYTTLIGISNVQRLIPYNIKKRDRRAWVVLPS